MASNEKARVDQLNQRALFYGRPADEKLTIYDIRGLLDLFKRTCSKCGKHPATSPNHVKPLAKGGENKVTNLDLLCTPCNKQERDSGNDYRNGVILTEEYCQQFYPENQQSPQDKREKHNWDEIETDYVTTDETLRDLSKKYGPSLSHIGMVASRDDWEGKRRNYRNKIGTAILKEIEARNVEEGFSAYRATFVLVRRAFDDYVSAPHPDKLKAIDGILNKALALEGKPTDNKQLTLKDWRDVAGKDTTPIQEFADSAAETYFNGGDFGGDREPGAGWTD